MSTSIRLPEVLSHLTQFSVHRHRNEIESKECLTTSGYYLVKTRSLTEIVKASLLRIKDLLPLIENGPVPAIKSSYLTISSLSGHLSNAIKQFDDESAEEDRCGPILDRLFGSIAQFASLVPIIASSAADSLFSQVDSMKETIEQSVSIAEELIQKVGSNLSAIQVETDDPLALALSSMLENIDKMVFSLTVHLKIESYAPAKEMIEKWMEKLTQLAVDIFSLATSEPKNAIPLVCAVLNEKPSIFEVLEQCTDLAPFDPNVFSPLQAAFRLYGNMWVIEGMEYKSTVSECIAGLGEAYKSKSLLHFTRKADDLLTALKLRQVVPTEVLSGIDAIRNVPGREAQYVIAVAKAFGASFGDFSLVSSSCDCVFKETIVILNALLNELKASAQAIQTFVINNIVFLNEKDAAKSNAYTTRILETKEFQPDENAVPLILATLFSSGSLTSSIKALSSSETDIVETLGKLAVSHSKVSSRYSAWVVELLNTVFMQSSIFIQISMPSTDIDTLSPSADLSLILAIQKDKKCPYNISFDSTTVNMTTFLMNLSVEDIGASICSLLSEAMSFADGAYGYFTPLACSHTLVNTACAIAEYHNRFSQYVTSLKTVVEYSARMPSAVPSYRKTLEEAALAASSLPQPELAIELPQPVKRIRKLEAFKIENKKLKELGSDLISECRFLLSDVHISFTESWYESAMSSLSEASIGYDIKQEDLIQKSAQILVSAILKNDSTWDSIFEAAFQKTKQYLDTKEPTESQIRDFTSTLYSLSLIHDPYKLSTSLILSDALTEIQEIRQENNDMRAMRALFIMTRMATVEKLNEETNELTSTIIEDLKENKIDSFLASHTDFLSRFKQYCMDPTEDILSISDQEALLDSIYESVSEFRETMNGILHHLRNGGGKGQNLDSLFRKASSLAYKTTITAVHSLSIESKYEFKHVVEALLIIVPAFVSSLNIALDMCEKENTQEDLIPFRRQMRYSVKYLDSFISLLESKKEEEEMTEYQQAKNNLAKSISELITHILRIHSRTTESRISEQFEEEKNPLLETLSEKIHDLQNSYDSVINLSIGETVDPFKDTFQHLIESIDSLKKAITEIRYTSSIISIQLSKPISEFSEQVSKLYEAMSKLSNEIIIKPDPEAASVVPDEFPLPTLPDSIDLQSGLSSLKELQQSVLRTIENLKTQFNDSTSSNEDILVSLKELTDVCQRFSVMATRIAVSTKDIHLQVQQQASIHSFANNITTLYEAVRAMMMRVEGYDIDFTDAVSAIEKSLNISVEYAENAAKVVPAPRVEEQDEVSAELLATSRAIEEMSAKLKQFEGALGTPSGPAEEIQLVSDEAEDIPDDSVNNEELSSFVVRMSSPILQAAALILKRAQTITTQLVKQFGHIENKRLLIGSAQDLTEAAGLLLACAEMLIDGQDKFPEFQVIAAARIVKANISSLVAQVLVQGGDPEGIMNKYVKVVRLYSDKIVKKAMSIVEERAAAEAASSPRKTTGNKMVQKLNMQTQINDLRKQMENDERALYQFRRSHH